MSDPGRDVDPPRPAWPEEAITQAEAERWIAAEIGRAPGAPEILQVKRWGVTARFGDVVLKASYTPLFPQVIAVHAALERALPGAAPRLLASVVADGQLWTLFEHVPGPTVEETGTPAALIEMARRTASIQTALAGQDLDDIPAIDVRSVPSLLLDELDDQPAELVDWLRAAQPALAVDATALAELPSSLDHPDLNVSNAILCADDDLVILDWEEATVGCPLFSLARLLDDARERGIADEVTEAYLAASPGVEREHLERALRLVPLKLAFEARAFARGLGWAHPHTRYTTRLLEQVRESYR